jgi:hypothetical protein
VILTQKAVAARTARMTSLASWGKSVGVGLHDWAGRYLDKTGSGPLGRWLAARYPHDLHGRIDRLVRRSAEFFIEAGILWLVFGALEAYREPEKPLPPYYWLSVVGGGFALLIAGWLLEFVKVPPSEKE